MLVDERTLTKEADLVAAQLAVWFEDSLVQLVRSTRAAPFARIMIVDMCDGWLSAFVVNVSKQGKFRIIPRTIKVEEAERILNGLEQVKTCAYRRTVNPKRWTACTSERLKSFEGDPEYFSVTNIISYALGLSAAHQVPEFALLWHAFLAALWQADSMNDYEQVFVVVDSPEAQSLLQSALPIVAPKHPANGSLWAEAVVIDQSVEGELQGYILVDSPMDITSLNERALYLDGVSSAVVHWHNGTLRATPITGSESLIDLTCAVIIDKNVKPDDAPHGVHIFKDDVAARAATLAGYVYTLTQIDERALTRITQQRDTILAQLTQTRSQNERLRALKERFTSLFAAIC